MLYVPFKLIDYTNNVRKNVKWFILLIMLLIAAIYVCTKTLFPIHDRNTRIGIAHLIYNIWNIYSVHEMKFISCKTCDSIF